MVAYLMISIVLAVLGLSVLAGFLFVMVPRARQRRELARKRHEIGSQDELEDFIRRVSQVTSDEELDHLDEQKGDD